MEKLFGSADLQLLAQGGAKAPVSALAAKQVVGLYFSAHWCPPCRGFTPKLADAYEKITKIGKSFEVVFVSSDKDEEQFASYFKEMPWLALPFENRDLKKALSKKFKVSGIPALVLLDGATGQVLNKDGRSVVMADQTGEKFPWTPKPLQEALGDIAINGEGAEVKREEAFKDKYLALYFSAHWCPPCKRFTPELAKTYAAMKAKRDDFEFVFVSGDRDEKSFKDYFAQMPWLALPYDKERYEALSSHLEVEGIPTLVVLDPQGKVITSKGREAASSDPEGAEFPWRPKPVNSLESVASDLNESAALIVLCEKASEADKAQIAAALAAPANEVMAEAHKEAADPELIFATAETPDGNIAGQVRQLTNLDKDGAGSSSTSMVILDIPDDGAYYVWKPEGEKVVSETAVRDFLAAYKAKTLERHQLG
jgi:nucleoredoxin